MFKYLYCRQHKHTEKEIIIIFKLDQFVNDLSTIVLFSR